MREKFFNWLAAVTYNHSLLVFTICVIVTMAAGMMASTLRMDMTWSAMVPEEDPAKKALETIMEDFGAATQIVFALEGPDKDKLISATEELALMLKETTAMLPGENGEAGQIKVLKNIQARYDTAFIAKHGFMMQKAKDLRTNSVMFSDYNLTPYLTHTNDVLESEYVSDSDNMAKQENELVRTLDGMYRFIESLSPAQGSTEESEIRKTVDELTIGNGYFLSTDKKMQLIMATPVLSINAPIDQTVIAVNAIDSVLQEFSQAHPDIHVGMSGGHVVMRDEMEVGMEDTEKNVIVAFTIILLVFILSFRMVSGPLLAMLVLISGIMWDMGLTALVIGRLSLMTAVCSVVLIGLGVDFAIHILSAYSEFRHKGHGIQEAMREALTRIGGGLLTGAITSSFAFLALILTSFPAFREFGFVVGAGIISCLAASFFFLPSAIVLKEKAWSKIKKGSKPKSVEMEFKFIGAIADTVAKRPYVTIITATLISIFLAMYIDDVRMNRNYMDMEPEGLESVRLQREIPKRFNMSPDNMIAVFENLEDAERVTDKLNERPSIGFVESLTEYLPSDRKQAVRIPEIDKIAAMQNNIPRSRRVDKEALIEQIYRFNDNLTEMSSLAFIGGMDKVFDKTNHFLGLDEEGEQVGENRVIAVIDDITASKKAEAYFEKYQRYFILAMKERITGMANSSKVTMEDIPQNLKDRFLSNDGTQSIVMIYSKKDIWDGLFTDPFTDTVKREVPQATGMPVLMKAMVTTAKEQGRNAFLITFTAFFVVLLIDFRSIKIALTAAVPLVFSLLWMLGIMGLSGFPLSIINVIGLPLILGIGIDDGVHIIHRFKVEGRDKLRYTFSSIGKAVFLTTITTLLGFGSLIPSSYRGYASLGTLVVLGIGLCFITSVFVLPAFMKIAWKK